MSRPNGIVLYKGKSRLDGAPIVVILIGTGRGSKNGKTGRMLQTFILSDGPDDPIQATKDGADASVCGQCPHRPALGGSCYVNVGQAPRSVYRAYRRGRYPRFQAARHLDWIRGRAVRLGTYGDPAAVPSRIWRVVLSVAGKHTAYSHQWERFPSLRTFAMASVDTPAQAERAWAAGWRTFRVRREDEPLLPGEIMCVASH
jgi:hypothetical protein